MALKPKVYAAHLSMRCSSLHKKQHAHFRASESMNPRTLSRAVPGRYILPFLIGGLFASVSLGQTPGMPQSGSQSTRFDNDFNPAIGMVLDLAGTFVDAESSAADGFELSLRSTELSFSSWVDPTAWAYANVVFAKDEIALEEGAVHYVGFEGNTTLRAGRFFVDFGKQMQAHMHALRTFDRPAVLRAFLGSELGGDGMQYDSWTTAGEATIVRWSLGAFNSLVTESDAELPSESAFRPSLSELALTARLTGYADVSESSTLQIGASMRYLPDFEIHDEANDVKAIGLSNTVFGLDATWGWLDDTNTKGWTAGMEWLAMKGDMYGESLDLGGGNFAVTPINDSAMGYYVFVDRVMDKSNSAGVQFSSVELPQAGMPRLGEFDAYFTHKPTEFQRLRYGLTLSESEGQEEARLSVQYTLFLGPHAHGVQF